MCAQEFNVNKEDIVVKAIAQATENGNNQ